ncbi:hypothetical protein REPUB_Repub17cG0192400 [Reevesia pubescens]
MATYLNDSKEDRERLDIEYYGEADMSEENLNKYNDQVNATGGYDVDVYPGFAFSLILPVQLDEDTVMEFTSYAKMAISDYNNKNHENFKFKKLLKGNVQASRGPKYYLTFEAEDANNGRIETFQGLIWRTIPKKGVELEPEVVECRIKPTTLVD